MKNLYQFTIIILLLPFLSACLPTDLKPTTVPSNTASMTPSTVIPTARNYELFTATASVTPSVTLTQTTTVTPTPNPTLVPEQAQALIKTLLQDAGDCSIPCFWGIIPGSTTVESAESILSHFGTMIYRSTLNNQDTIATDFLKLDDGLSIHFVLTIVKEIIYGIRVTIIPEPQIAGVERDWKAYSPETIIKQQGIPTKVELSLGRGPLTPFDILFYYDEYDTIIEYYIFDLGSNFHICPLTDQIEGVTLWMGTDLYHPPLPADPLESVTTMTITEFADLLTKNGDEACFDIDPTLFP